MMRRPLLFAVLPLVACTPLLAASASDAERAAATIDAAALTGPIRFLSSDALEGRGPGSRGDLLARAYLASELEAMGYEPAGTNGTFQQTVEMVGLKSSAPARWTFRAGVTSVDLAWHEDYIGSTGVQEAAAGFRDTEIVFVGYGIQAPEYGWDDFKGVDLKGKVLLMLNNDPDWDDALFAGKRRLYYVRWVYKYESAARQGAAAAIIVHTTPSAGYPWQVVQTSWGGEQFELPAGNEPRIQFKAWATEAATRRLLAAAGQDLDKLVALARSRDFRPVPLGIRTALETSNAVRRIETGNVLGLLRGSDPKLRDEVVVYTAHHDHLGIGAPDTHGDTVYNGAIDNASGCAQLVTLARAFMALPERPRRSILFAFVAAEEQGLLGSAYLASHLPFAAGKIAADINFDAGNVFGRTHDITYIGYGKSTLDHVVETEAAMQGRVVKGDQYPDRGSFYRSDQFKFAKIGVPALYLGGGTDYIGKDPEFGKNLRKNYESTCYHQPCDEMHADWDFAGMVEDTRLGFACGRTIADADAMPAWNKGDEFEAARLAALAAAAAPAAGQVASDDGFDPAVAHPAFPPGGGPRLLVDEAHRNLHTASGRYAAFAHVATLDGFRVEGWREPFGPVSLPPGAVLVIANASGPEGANSEPAFAPVEIVSLVRWVEDGGSLFLITDHSPFGAAAASLGRALGVGMNDGEVSDVEHQARELPGPSFLEFTPANGLLGVHAITTGARADERVSRIVTFGGQALVPLDGSAVLLRLGARAIASAAGGSPESAVGGEAQMIAFERGRGRVVVTGEAGMFGAQVLRGEASRRAGVSDPFYFGMNLPGCDNKQLLLNTLRWLARAPG